MRGLFGRDPLVVGRFGACLGGVAWLWLGGAHSTLGIGHRLPTIAWGVADASGEATVDALVEAADCAMYRQKQLMRKRTPA
jgi:hypothetical protein